MSEWKETILSKCILTNTASINQSYPYKVIQYLDTGSITCNRIETLQEIPIKDAPSRAKRLVKDADIVYSTVRPNQLHYGFISKPVPNLVVSTGFVVIESIKEKIIPKYLYYFLTQKENTDYLHSIAEASTSAYPSLKPSDIEALEINLPPLPEQRAIAGVLSSLDDKIDLLHRQNKTLEAMAETLFRQWFVEAADEGWEEGNILRYCTHYKESVKPQAHPDIKFAHFSIPSFDDNKKPQIELGSQIRSNKYIVPSNCILFSKLNPHKDKRIWILLNEVNNYSICSTEFQVIKPHNEKSLFFLYGWLSVTQNYNEIASGVGGTSGSHQRIDPENIFSFHCPVVSDKCLEQYNSVITPIFRKQNENQKQIRILEKLRDTLLPKLMSGEVRVAI
jgi:type I restriction enzyme, S subunit